jgi:hypothetical protein
MWRILLYGFLVYFLYKVLFELILPVFNTTRKMRKDFKNMQGRMNDFMKNQQQDNNKQNKSGEFPEAKNKSGDYIEFEEVK